MNAAASPGSDGLIGPNAILQLAPVLERAGGGELRDHIMALGGVFELPSDAGLMPEGPAARVHQAMRAELPDLAPGLAWEAGRRTGLYILANGIPRPAQLVLKTLPPPLAARMLKGAISRHAWTFAGSGRFQAVSPYVFEIADNPIVAGERSEHPLCHWQAAVFETLYRRLVDPHMRCAESTCCATGAAACRFELTRRPAHRDGCIGPV